MSTDEQTMDLFQSPLEICWQFDYEGGVEKLRSLYSKSKRAQWDAEDTLDWSHPVDPSRPLIDENRFGLERLPFMQRLSKSALEKFRVHMTAYQLSQFLHGEQGAMMTAAVLTHAVPDYDAKLYAATQTMDEARHVEAYQKYLDKLGMVYPMGHWLKALIDETLKSGHWVKVAIGMNMVVEGLALASFHNMRRATTCDLLRDLTDNVLRDEARHVAFGNVYVGQAVSQMHSDDREEIAQFAFDAVALMAGKRPGQAGGGGLIQGDPLFLKVLENAEIDPGDFFKSLLEARAQGLKIEPPDDAVHAFKDLMMPALSRVGAVTERTRALYAEVNIPIFEDCRILESLEDSDSGSVEL